MTPSSQPLNNFYKTKRGFTLLEMLVATTILATLLILFSQIAENTMRITQINRREIDVATQARGAFDKIAQAIDGVGKTRGSAIALLKNGGGSVPTVGKLNDTLAFISNSRSDTPGGRFSTIAIKIRQDTDPLSGTIKSPMLEWLATSSPWSKDFGSTLFDFTKGLTGDNIPSGVTPIPLAPNIFRLEVSLLLSDGSIVNSGSGNIPIDVTISPPSANPQIYYLSLSYRTSDDSASGKPYDSKRHVKALIVGLGGISNEIRLQLSQMPSNPYNTLPDILADPQNIAAPIPANLTNATPLDTWDMFGANSQTKNNLKNLPVSVSQGLRYYQRYFYIN